MSDEVPVSDVLLEATEYLCKLGSNLRVRSENLKVKRISKEKLRNTHAVQKAADKILLICELSKKSLENVETGVQKILAVCGGNKNTRSSTPTSKTPPFKAKEKINYHYIEYKSRKLRILQKVSLKHYRSVQVVVTNMPPSMVEKYPVHYNCKLYRMRKRRDTTRKTCDSDNNVSTLKDKERQETQSDHDDSYKQDKNSETSRKESSAASAKEIKSSKLKVRDVFTESEEEKSTKAESDKHLSSKRRKSVSCDDKDHSAIRKYSLSDSNDEDDRPTKTKQSSKSTEENNKSSAKRKDSNESNSVSNKDTKTSRAAKHETPAQKKFRNIRVIDDSSSNSGNDNSNNKEIKPNEGKETGNKTNYPKESTDNITEISEDSDQENKTNKKLGSLSDSDEQSQKQVSQNSPSGSKNDDKSNSESDTPCEKPLLKCIDITKLLKPEVVKAVTGKSPKKTELQKNESNSRNKDIKNNIKTKRLSNKKLEEEEEENYWEKKRKEVSAFKPKKFQIKVFRLGEYSEQFLIRNSIKRITQKGKIVTEIGSDKKNGKNKNVSFANVDDNSVQENKATKVGDKDHKIIKAKSALLDDSDSDKGDSQSSSPTSAMLEAERIRKSLLHDSDSSNEGLPRSSLQNKNSTNKNKSDEKKKGDSDKNYKKESSNDDSEKIKKTSLDDSDEKTLEEQTTKNSNAITKCDKGIDLKRSNQKTNREKSDENSAKDNDKDIPAASEKIKNALLHDSDSDKNPQDEQNKENTDAISKSDKGMKLKKPDKMTDGNISERDTAKESDVEIRDASEKIRNALLDDSDSDKNSQVKPDDISKSNEGQDIKMSGGEKSNEESAKDGSDKNENTSSKEVDKNDSNTESNKHSYVNDEKGEKTPKKKRKRSESHTPQSKRKNIMESMHAKKMLLTYSSSSDTEDEELKKALKEIKNSLLEGSDDEPSKNLKNVCRKKLIASSSSSEEDITKVIEKSRKPKKKKKSKRSKMSSSEEGAKEEKGSRASISQVDGNMDESSSSSSKMGRSKTKASGSHNSETQDSDKNIDGLTNMRTVNKPSRQRDSSSTSKTEETSSTKLRSRLPKAPAMNTENLLEAESNSSNEESGHDGEDIEAKSPVKVIKSKRKPSSKNDKLLEVECSSSEDSDSTSEKVEDLPPVAISTLNGGGLQHLAKDDLLDESEASSSSNKSSEENKKDDETDEENPKSKRRKALAISSDSEGASRKKDRNVKFSDFEDSEADSSEPATKKNKRKKKGSDSDASGGSSDAGKKKRRRIKQLDDSDASGSESETEGQKRGRKNIRRVMGKDQLEEATKKAAREEKERVARIAERQKMYNNLQFDESGKPDEVALDKVILDFDPDTKEPLIQLDKGLVKKLKPHQANGIKFMWDACFESVKRIKKDKGSGCILAHCMGLGKTLQVVSLTHTLLTHSNLTKVNRVLVVCPLSTVLNWVNEFNMWLKHTEADYEVDVYELSRFKQNSERAFQLSQWYNGGGVCVLGYEMFRNLSADNPKKYRKKMLKSFQEALVDPGPDMVVCDEGHLLKNEKTSLSQSMNRVKTQRRIVLTGTPLQNNLKEYYCMVQFVKPNLLGKYNEYLNRFVNPITNGQYTDSTDHDIRIMKRRSHVLHTMLDGAVQRRDYGVLAPFLPPKHEYVLFITLTEVQTKLYQFYLDNYSRRPQAGKSSGFLFPDFQSLQRIWTHPLVLKYNSERYEIMQQKKRDKEEEEDSEGSLVDFIDDESTSDESSSDSSSDLSDASDDSRKKAKKKKNKKPKKDAKGGRRTTRANPVEQQDLDAPATLDDLMEVKYENPTEWWIKLVNDDELDNLKNSHKLVLLFDILRQCEAIGDKLLVFSQSLYSLDLIEHFLSKVDEATQDGRVDEKLGGHVGSWSPGIDYFRLDGSTSCENRSIWCKNFNREDNPRARLFLISTRAGGLGINLVAANRVVIFDVSWNPSHDVQSIFRVYRFGQKKPCYVYRFLAMGTMEEKIYERQVTKQAISKRVIDEQQIDRHYKENDLAELYTFEPKPPEPRPLPPLPKDRLFAEMLKDHDKLIYKYHEHDSLLENKEEETLTEEERKAAWEDFENEKNRPPPAPFPNVWPMQNGMAPGFLAQQQQQLAYAALATMLRKDMPNINENQIRDMLPLIYNANPALMQKMSEQMYKYTQPGLMNPMMNMSMNPGAAGMGGGTSGLQYEPPWQRQQQQQQQMRLQQMLQQQQNSMGAKYYAGGLGSRDPVAMALQQQQARAIMVGDTRGRPRGRPPQPRPPQTSQDVVNLDSD